MKIKQNKKIDMVLCAFEAKINDNLIFHTAQFVPVTMAIVGNKMKLIEPDRDYIYTLKEVYKTNNTFATFD